MSGRTWTSPRCLCFDVPRGVAGVVVLAHVGDQQVGRQCVGDGYRPPEGGSYCWRG